MANEAQWEVVPRSYTVDDVDPLNTNAPITRVITTSNTDEAKDYAEYSVNEPKPLQIGSQLLYTIKEHLKKAGWTVVSCSYRLRNKYVDGTNYGFWSTDLVNNKRLFVGGSPVTPAENGYAVSDSFAVSTEDMWTPQIGYRGGNPSTNPGESFYWGTGLSDSNPAWSVIYPDHAPFTTYAATPNANIPPHYRQLNTDTRRGLVSFFYNTGTGVEKTAIGRSWILLKCPDEFCEPHQQANPPSTRKRYHILLDYVDNLTPPYIINNFNYFDTFKTSPDADSRFGESINIVIFPDYNPGDSLTNQLPSGAGSYTPAPWVRPSHKNEVSAVVRNVVPITAGSNVDASNTYFKFVYDPESYHFNNTINTVQSESNGGIVLLGSANGTPTYSIVLGTIGDPINPEIIRRNAADNTINGGTKFFMFWSGITRRYGATNTTLTPLNINNTIATLTTVPTNIGNIQNTIFDAREKYGCIFYYNVYRADLPNPKFETRTINSCMPVFLAESTPTRVGAHLLMANRPFAGSTSDYTFMEWPLPLIYVQGASRNFNYAGRMMDIKLGPAAGPNGILARESGSVEYDRILMGGIWYPFSGTDTILF